ncbi:MAG: ribose 5-phosphate isomerase B [Candidatus Promineifilaceae bacterium]
MSVSQEEVAALVRQAVGRLLGTPGRPILDEEAVRRLPAGSTHALPAGALVTPLARQAALEQHIRLVAGDPAGAAGPAPDSDGRQVVALGADHGGYELKERLKAVVEAAGYAPWDCGTHGREAVDYPDYAYAVARLVADGRAWRGIIVDGAGIGSCMAANKVPGVRAAMCYDQATAVNSREHNNANVLTLGAGLIGPALASQIVTAWLATEFGGGRHAGRVAKIDALDRRYARSL